MKSSIVDISEWESKIKMKGKDLKTMMSWTSWRYVKGSGGSSGWKYCDLNRFDGYGSAEVGKVFLPEKSFLGFLNEKAGFMLHYHLISVAKMHFSYQKKKKKKKRKQDLWIFREPTSQTNL